MLRFKLWRPLTVMHEVQLPQPLPPPSSAG